MGKDNDALAREVEKLRKENKKLREQVNTIKTNNARHIYQLCIVTHKFDGMHSEISAVTTESYFYAKKPDAINDIKFHYYQRSHKTIPDNESPEELTICAEAFISHLKITEINII